MHDPTQTQRPGVLNLIAVVSFVLSGANVLWLIGVGLLMALAGALSWLGGPIVGAIGTAAVVVVLILIGAQFLLSILLFSAGWQTWKGRPGGRSRHKTWAWITVGLDLLTLLFTGGIDPGAWTRLIYAVVLIYVLDQREIRDYFERRALPG